MTAVMMAEMLEHQVAVELVESRADNLVEQKDSLLAGQMVVMKGQSLVVELEKMRVVMMVGLTETSQVGYLAAMLAALKAA